jgi:hypothetical protein
MLPRAVTVDTRGRGDLLPSGAMRPAHVTRSILALTGFLLAGCSTDLLAPVVRPSERPGGHVILVSIDGLLPESYLDPDAHGLEVPTLRELLRTGAHSDGMEPVLPTVTYPNHVSMVTGVAPAEHGIYTNLAFDPLGKNQRGWRWYAEDIRATPIWEAAAAAGLETALINWPVTVGAQARWLVPEYWRAGTSEDQKLARALSTPGLLEAVESEYPDLWQGFTPPKVADEASTDIAVHLIEHHRPELLLLHIWMVDEMQHVHTPWSAPARAAIETADRQVGRIIEAARRAGTWERTTLLVVSDHGFAVARQRFRPGVLLQQHGLVTLDAGGQVVDWKAVVAAESGYAYVYVKDPADGATRQTLRQIFVEQRHGAIPGLGRVLEREQIAALGGDPTAELALEPSEGHGMSAGYSGDLVVVEGDPGVHGQFPDRADMKASLLVRGAGIRPGLHRGARTVDIAASIAHWLGLPDGAVRGRPLGLAGAADP